MNSKLGCLGLLSESLGALLEICRRTNNNVTVRSGAVILMKCPGHLPNSVLRSVFCGRAGKFPESRPDKHLNCPRNSSQRNPAGFLQYGLCLVRLYPAMM